jgi:hypothetical protein
VLRRSLPLLLALAAVALTGCGGGSATDSADATVTELTSVDQLASAFEADKGKPRLVLLLSPT